MAASTSQCRKVSLPCSRDHTWGCQGAYIRKKKEKKKKKKDRGISGRTSMVIAESKISRSCPFLSGQNFRNLGIFVRNRPWPPSRWAQFVQTPTLPGVASVDQAFATSWWLTTPTTRQKIFARPRGLVRTWTWPPCAGEPLCPYLDLTCITSIGNFVRRTPNLWDQNVLNLSDFPSNIYGNYQGSCHGRIQVPQGPGHRLLYLKISSCVTFLDCEPERELFHQTRLHDMAASRCSKRLKSTCGYDRINIIIIHVSCTGSRCCQNFRPLRWAPALSSPSPSLASPSSSIKSNLSYRPK